MVPRKIILDMDNGLTLPVTDTDDALALALALTSPEVDLLACTSCGGNCRSRQSAENTLRMLELARRTDIPVAVGREAPLVRNRDAHFAHLDGKSATSGARFWAGLPRPEPPATEPCGSKAHELIIAQVRAHPGEVALVMLGALTNLALALLAEPEIAPLIGGVVHMGGGFQPTEPDDAPLVWDTPDIPDAVWRETLRFNTMFDPEASAIVFNAGLDVTLVPVNVTARVFQRPGDLEGLKNIGTPFHDLLWSYGCPWVDWSVAVRKLPGAHMHDPLALATLIDPTLCRYRTMGVDPARLLAGAPDWLGEAGSGQPVQVAVAVAADRFEALLNRRLARSPKRP